MGGQQFQVAAVRRHAVHYFNIGANDTKNTLPPTETRIRIHIVAGIHTYDYDGTTIAGETVGEIVQQVYQNTQPDWKVEYFGDRTGLIVSGCAPVRRTDALPFAAIKTVGIRYSGKAQPILPGTQGGVQLLTFDKGKWKAHPKKK